MYWALTEKPEMIFIGQIQYLKIAKRETFGVYLSESGDKEDERVLLPIKQVPEGAVPGDEVEVFIYRDSKDRLIATTTPPAITAGGLALLRVVDTSKIGAFLDMGLERDLFLPFKEMTYPVKKGDEVLVTMYVDKSSRLAASMKVYHCLKTGAPYKAGDEVSGLIYESSDNFGLFMAVDDMYSARIPKRECFSKDVLGQRKKARVTRVLEDGKLDVSLRDPAYSMIDTDSEVILKALEDNGGELMLSDSSSPDEIRERLKMSKAAFKRAIGHLYKDGIIEIKEDRIVKKN